MKKSFLLIAGLAFLFGFLVWISSRHSADTSANRGLISKFTKNFVSTSKGRSGDSNEILRGDLSSPASISPESVITFRRPDGADPLESNLIDGQSAITIQTTSYPRSYSGTELDLPLPTLSEDIDPDDTATLEAVREIMPNARYSEEDRYPAEALLPPEDDLPPTVRNIQTK